jgi:hypothetical protein
LYSLVIFLFIETEQQHELADDTMEKSVTYAALTLNSLATASKTEV